MKLLTRLTTVAGVAFAACALPAAGALAADLKVGFITSLSGPVSSLGIPYDKGIAAATIVGTAVPREGAWVALR